MQDTVSTKLRTMGFECHYPIDVDLATPPEGHHDLYLDHPSGVRLRIQSAVRDTEGVWTAQPVEIYSGAANQIPSKWCPDQTDDLFFVGENLDNPFVDFPDALFSCLEEMIQIVEAEGADPRFIWKTNRVWVERHIRNEEEKLTGMKEAAARQLRNSPALFDIRGIQQIQQQEERVAMLRNVVDIFEAQPIKALITIGWNRLDWFPWADYPKLHKLMEEIG